MQEPIPGKVERIDLNLGFLSGPHKADVAVRYHCFNFELAVARHDHEQGLRGRDDTAHRVNRELLHRAIHRSGQQLKPDLLLRLDQVLGEPVCFLLGLGKLFGQAAPIFCRRLATRFANRSRSRLRLLQMALLDGQFLLLLDQLLENSRNKSTSSPALSP